MIVMSKKLLIAEACVMALVLLVGCQADEKSQEESVAEASMFSFSESNENVAEETKGDTEDVSTGAEVEDTENVDNKSGTREECGNVSNDVERGTTDSSQSSQNSQSANNPEQNTGSSGQSVNSGQSLSQSASQNSTGQSASSQSKEYETPQPTAQNSVSDETSKQTEEIKPNIDIDAQVSFAKSYAESIGLTLDSTAIDCWDNPITVSLGKPDATGDIKSRLNRYKNTDGFTSVWVWAVKISDTEYELYIGYA